MKRLHWLIVGLVAVFVAGSLAHAQNLTPLTITTAKGTHRFMVELADTPERRAVGLMHRPSMPADHGMLFDFKTDAPVAMWMRNTRIPLDMLFIARDGRIVNIAERTVPFSETAIPSNGPVRAVLELNGGTTARLGIKPGDRVSHPMFRSE
jgi:uncharacterized membrane protein (UPF0127 family)